MDWFELVSKGVYWIQCKWVSYQIDKFYVGLLLVGFSVEYLGLNDYYYWDDFWGIVGLQVVLELLVLDDLEVSWVFVEGVEEFMCIVDCSFVSCQCWFKCLVMLVLFYWCLDVGVIGFLVVGYFI